MAPKQDPAPVFVKPAGLILPVQILTTGDVSRLARELQDMEQFFAEAAIKGATAKSVPQASLQLMILVKDNGLNLLHGADRLKLKEFVELVGHRAPIVHLSFATDPKPEFLMKLLTWFRTNADPFVLIKVGLQPNIAAGCVLRTTNKYFDLSFKQQFLKSKAKLALALEASS